jgi:outer membrane lipoprotein-sorting protein
MTIFREHPWSRWAVPVAAFGVIGATAVVTNQQANADPGLPHRTAAQLLADVRSSNVQTLSGTIVQTADLGLPQLPGLSGGAGGPGGGGRASAGSGATGTLSTLLTGSHTWRVWVDGPTRQRLALIDGSNESDIIHNGADVWLWSSADKSAVHRRVPTMMHPLPRHSMTPSTKPGASPSTGQPGVPTTAPATPEEAASQALAMMGQDTTVTTSGTATVAGRAAYELVLTPKDKATRIASVRIAIDGQRHVPLRVQVYSTKLANPAFQVGFTSVDFAKPDASRFTFTPPPGTKVTDKGTAPTPTVPKASGTNPTPTRPGGPSAAGVPTPKVVGSGWSTVVVATVPKDTSGASGSTQQSLQQQLGPVLGSLPQVSGSWGRGRLLEGTLFSAVLTDDGRVAVGAVGPDQLYAALAAK